MHTISIPLEEQRSRHSEEGVTAFDQAVQKFREMYPGRPVVYVYGSARTVGNVTLWNFQ